MVAVIEAVLELEARVLALDLDDPADIAHVPSRRLLAEHVHAALQTGDRRLGRQIVRQTDDQRVQILLEQAAIVIVEPHTVVEGSLLRQHAVTDGNCAESRMGVDDCAAAFADHPVAGDADLQLAGHQAVPASGDGVR